MSIDFDLDLHRLPGRIAQIVRGASRPRSATADARPGRVGGATPSLSSLSTRCLGDPGASGACRLRRVSARSRGLHHLVSRSRRRSGSSGTRTSMASISTNAPRGSAATPTAARAGYGCLNSRAMISLTRAKLRHIGEEHVDLHCVVQCRAAAAATAAGCGTPARSARRCLRPAASFAGSSPIWPER